MLERHPYLHTTLAWFYHLTGDARRAEAELDRLYAAMPEIAERHGEFLEASLLLHALDHRHAGGSFFRRIAPEIRSKLDQKRLQFPGMSKNLPFAHKGAKDICDFPGMPESTVHFDRVGPSLGPGGAAVSHAMHSGLWLERDERERALAYARKAESLLPEDPVPDTVFTAMMAIAAALEAMEQTEAAREQLERTRRRLEELGALYLLPNLQAYETKLRLSDGEFAAAGAWLDNPFIESDHTKKAAGSRAPLELFRIFQHLATARALMVGAPVPAARSFLERLIRLATDFRRTTDRAEAMTLMSILEWNRGVRDKALAPLEEAIRSVFPYRYVRVFADEGATLLPILKAISGRVMFSGKPEPELSQHIQKIQVAADEKSRRHKGLAWAMVSVPAALSKQQLQLLSLLAEGCPRRDILEKLNISVNSMKTQLRRAYRKLEADNAQEAIAKAYKKGWLRTEIVDEVCFLKDGVEGGN